MLLKEFVTRAVCFSTVVLGSQSDCSLGHSLAVCSALISDENPTTVPLLAVSAVVRTLDQATALI
jgi:hypothetical protein